jgi:hypothetical protein
MGMADGRCITSFDSNRIMTDVVMQQNKIAYQDNYKFRTLLQAQGPSAFSLPLKNGACRTSGVKVLVEDE